MMRVTVGEVITSHNGNTMNISINSICVQYGAATYSSDKPIYECYYPNNGVLLSYEGNSGWSNHLS